MAHASRGTFINPAIASGSVAAGMAPIIARPGHSGRTGAPGENSMSMRMLIDARHPEETRVAVVKGNRIEEFDFESAEHKQLKGNIYLAKVTRVEPSLQAAFIDYGGNRHGFLAFSEIHPDYYQIPKADREALLREEAEHAAEEERLRAAEFDDADDRRRSRKRRRTMPRRSPRRRPRQRRPRRRPRPAPARAARRSTNPPPTSCARSARTCAAATRSRTSSSAARCCSSRSSRKSAATRARR